MNQTQPITQPKDLVFWLKYYLNWYDKGYKEFIPNKSMFWTNWPITAVAKLLEHAIHELGSVEPKLHSNLGGELHPYNPLASHNQICKECNGLVYNAKTQETIYPWFETGDGVYCHQDFFKHLSGSQTIEDKFALPVTTGPVDMGEIPPAIPKFSEEQKAALSQGGDQRVLLQAAQAFQQSPISKCSDADFQKLIDETWEMRRMMGVTKAVPQSAPKTSSTPGGGGGSGWLSLFKKTK